MKKSKKLVVKMTIGPYLNTCQKVKEVGAENLIEWLRSHEYPLGGQLTDHVVSCHRCKEIHKRSIMLVPVATNEEVFDLATCVEVNKHSADLIFWLYSIKETKPNLFMDATFHLGICPHCPSITNEEEEEIDTMTTSVC